MSSMSVDIERAGADIILEAARRASELEAVRNDSPGDSSSLSEMDYKGSHQEEEEEEEEEDDEDDDEEDFSDEQIDSEEVNDSEAETERLEESPNKFRIHQNVVLSSQNDNQIQERTPSKLQHQLVPVSLDDEDDDDESLSDAEVSMGSSPKSSPHGSGDPGLQTVATSLEDSASEVKRTLQVADLDTRKRKRSIMAGSGLDEDVEEPLRKRTGSVIAPGDDYAIDDDEEQPDEEAEAENIIPVSGNITDEDGGDAQEETVEDLPEPMVGDEGPAQIAEAVASPRKYRGRKKKKGTENGIGNHDEDAGPLPEADPTSNLNDEDIKHGDEEIAHNDGFDEAEAAARNEEEQERKRIALEQLSTIEKQFSTFRERLYDERLAQLNREEAMLREDKPSHPEYLAMMQAIDARMAKKARKAEIKRKLELEALNRIAVAGRSQILTQFQQEVRAIREKAIDQLGKQWYEIQHDRRTHAGSVPDYTLKFPTLRAQQVANQVAYSNEVSILSGIAKHIGFPSAPEMAKVTQAELDDDMEKMGRSRQPQPVHHIAVQELAALRTAGSRIRPAEEQFIERTPWANPQHPSHAHLLQRQPSVPQVTRIPSPFSQSLPRRPSGPISGTFSNTPLHHLNGHSTPANHTPAHNPFSNSTLAHVHAPSPLGSRQPSLSPQQNKQPPGLTGHIPHNTSALLNSLKGAEVFASGSPILPDVRDVSQESRREQTSVMLSRI